MSRFGAELTLPPVDPFQGALELEKVVVQHAGIVPVHHQRVSARACSMAAVQRVLRLPSREWRESSAPSSRTLGLRRPRWISAGRGSTPAALARAAAGLLIYRVCCPRTGDDRLAASRFCESWPHWMEMHSFFHKAL